MSVPTPNPEPGPHEPARGLEACQSCGALRPQRYCGACGEKRLEPERDHSLSWLLGQVLDGVLHFDTKLLRTFSVLVFTPGRLSRAFLEGRRVRYLQPLSLFAIASIVFYLLFPNAYSAQVETMQRCLRDDVWIGNLLRFDFDAHLGAVAAQRNESIELVRARVRERSAEESKIFLGLLVPWLAIVLHATVRRAQPKPVPNLVLALHLFVVFLALDLVFLLGWRLCGADRLADEQFAPLFAAYTLHSMLTVRTALQLSMLRALAVALACTAALVVGLVVYRQLVTVFAALSS